MEGTKPQRPYKRLHTDNAYLDQPEHTLTFALNMVRMGQHGGNNFPTTEQSNAICATLKPDYVLLGSIYIGKGDTAVFSVHKTTGVSEIGIHSDNCGYTAYVNDAGSTNKLGFKKHIPVTGIYRMREGCGRTLYFLTPKVMTYNFDSPIEFKKLKEDGTIFLPEQWDAERFRLFKTTSRIPNIVGIEIQETGQLKPGSYNISVQLLDADFNPTEFLVTTDTIIINNDNAKTKPFHAIRGSTGKKSAFQDFGVSNKAITFTFTNLDTNYLFYRVAIIAANNGSGKINEILYSSEIAIQNNTFTYDGTNHTTVGTLEEVQQFNNIIESARNIVQVENTLVLSDVRGKKIDLCLLQKYASRIRTDMVTKKITLNDINSYGNPKRGNVHNEALGCMPGELYSRGIVYVLKEFGPTPAYHIPGKNPNFPLSTSMAGNNEIDSYYTKNNSCAGGGWYNDYTGQPITSSTKVRHHRFPLRSERRNADGSQQYPLVIKEQDAQGLSHPLKSTIVLTVSGTVTDINTTQVTFRVRWKENTIDKSEDITINVDSGGGNKTYKRTIDNIYGVMTGVSSQDISTPSSGLQHSYNAQTVALDFDNHTTYTSEIFGFQFSNILPRDNNGNIDTKVRDDEGNVIDEIIGYYIVGNERDESNKSILDTGICCPTLIEQTDTANKNFNYIAHGHLMPNVESYTPPATVHQNFSNQSPAPINFSKATGVFAIIHPEFKFNGKEYSNTTHLIKEGDYVKRYATYISPNNRVQDVQPGTTYDPSRSDDSEKDTDGWTLHCLSRHNSMQYQESGSPVTYGKDAVDEIFYLDPLFAKTIKKQPGGERVDIYNLSADNRIGIVAFNGLGFGSNSRLQYVVMKRELSNAYAEFRTLPYYPLTQFYKADAIHDSVDVFSGDTYISSMKYMSSMFYNVKAKRRAQSTDPWWVTVIGVFLLVAGIILAPITGGFSLAASYYGYELLKAGYNKDQAAQVYKYLYEAGLRNTIDDHDTQEEFRTNPADDEIQWFHDSIDGIFLESSVNMNWRMGNTIGQTDFMDSPTVAVLPEIWKYCIDKLTSIDSTHNNGKNYLGFAKPEIYDINPDYLRRNKEKIFHHLPLEYDCCSNCKEIFPDRIMYSEQSFKEERTDNFRKFLPNNYIDVGGETGRITNMFVLHNNIYFHTEEAIWHLPNQHQERVTGDIVSFIGTGSFFAVPPRKIVDSDTGMSGGCTHKLAAISIPQGIFYPSERQRMMFIFDGQRLRPVNAGINIWLKDNMPILAIDPVGYVPDPDYPLSQSPMYDHGNGMYGAGYLAVYDSKKERVLITKRDSVRQDGIDLNNSWTLSYALDKDENGNDYGWQSFMSYMPQFYFSTPDKFYSGITASPSIWKHHKPDETRTFYGELYPFIIEYVSVSNPLITKTTDAISFITEARIYDSDFGGHVVTPLYTFNQAIFYNSKQCSGLLNLGVRDRTSTDYLINQITNLRDTITIARNEETWSINEMRDMVTQYGYTFFKTKLFDRQQNYFIDKALNPLVIDMDKDWTEREPFRDKYLVVRLIFNNFAPVELSLNYVINDEKQSFR